MNRPTTEGRCPRPSAAQRRCHMSRRGHQATPCAAELLEQRIALAVYTVANVSDTGPGSLRQAITDANAVNSDDTIVFDAAFFSAPRQIQIGNPLPTFGSNAGGLSIVGPGSALLTVRKTLTGSAATRRVFDSAAPRLSLSGMTVTGGNISGSFSTSNGAGLHVGGTSPNVVIDDAVFTDNSANFNNYGGAIAVSASGAGLTLRNSRVVNNDGGVGGGIAFTNGGSLLIENSTVADNRTFSFGIGDVSGGGLYFFGTARSNPPAGYTPNALVIRNSTFSGNRGSYDGGGVGLSQFTGTLIVENSTFSGNVAGHYGGGIAIGLGSGGVTLRNATVTDNTAQGDPFAGGGGGGIARRGSETGYIDLFNSVVAGNHHADAPDIRAEAPVNFVRRTNSLVGSPDGFLSTNPGTNNLPFGTDPMLGPLADNGGPTKTHAPLPESPLVDAGDDALVPAALTTDQRGPGFPRVVGPSVDIGAVERADDDAPRVTDVFVSGAAWAAPFMTYLQEQGVGDSAHGYRVPVSDAEPAQPLPWINLDRVTLRFSADVSPQSDSLSVRGVNTANYPIADFTYDPSAFTATWTLAQPLRNDKVLLSFAPGDVGIRVNVLPGDTMRNGTVVAADASDVKPRFFRSPAAPGPAGPTQYSIFHDVDASGQIIASDFSAVKARFFTALPGPGPTPVDAAGKPATSGSVVGDRPRRIAEELLV